MITNLHHRISALLMAGAIALSGAAATTAWRTQVDDCIANGNFSQARKIIKSLPKSTRKSEAVAIDSLLTIMDRITTDFTMKPEDGVKYIRDRYPATDAQIEEWKKTRKIEWMNIDGKEIWFRKAVGNLWLLAPEFAKEQRERLDGNYVKYLKYYRQAMATAADSNQVRNKNRVSVTFSLDVNADVVPAGEMVRVWMPVPLENLRQSNISIDATSQPCTFSTTSEHHTAYMEAKAQKGQPLHFEISYSYNVGERHFTQEDLLALLEPYDKQSEVYKKYTAAQAPHIVTDENMRKLAQSIVGSETNPVLQSAAIYKWIVEQFPWAGAREYSTLANIPQYVLDNGHGDCGQVALLYISLARSIGIPARWESGYMLHPGNINFHDWAETYFEGIGWVPTDPSFGRTTYGTPLEKYYITGIDIYRMATNSNIGQQLQPAKKWLRSETVDFQPGEVEWKGGNLYYDKWKSHIEVNSITPIK